MAFTVIAQQDTMNTHGDNLSFHCQIEGQDITFPCMWHDLEQIGWSFCNPKDSAPTYNLTLVDNIEVPVLSPQKRKAVIRISKKSHGIGTINTSKSDFFA